ncbi:MAG: hypothetical protein [Microviridae sp.]|nr:MAG: hypothetical protein [Microviridae sp.]
MNKTTKENRKREHSGKFTRRPFKKYVGSTEVPCFRCYLKTCGEPHSKAYIVRAVDIERFIDQQIKRNIMNIVEIVDYMYHELPHGTLFITE